VVSLKEIVNGNRQITAADFKRMEWAISILIIPLFYFVTIINNSSMISLVLTSSVWEAQIASCEKKAPGISIYPTSAVTDI